MNLHLPARSPFSFATVADSHGWRQLAPFTGDCNELRYIMHLASGCVIELRLTGAGAGASVSAEGAFSEAE